MGKRGKRRAQYSNDTYCDSDESYESEEEGLNDLEKFRLEENNKLKFREIYKDFYRADLYFKYLDELAIHSVVEELLYNIDAYSGYNKFTYIYEMFEDCAWAFLNILVEEKQQTDPEFLIPNEKQKEEICRRAAIWMMKDTSKYFITDWDKELYKKLRR